MSRLFAVLGVRERIRTPDTLVRSQVLYPAELRTRIFTPEHFNTLRFYCQCKVAVQLRINAADRNRTGTGITTHGILSPGRLPVPPLRRIVGS